MKAIFLWKNTIHLLSGTNFLALMVCLSKFLKKKLKVNFEGKNEEDALKYVHQYIASKCSDAAADSDVLNRIHFYNTSLINAKTTSKILSKVLSEIAKGTR